MGTNRRQAIGAMLGLVTLAGCNGGSGPGAARHKFNSVDISGGGLGGEFHLRDPEGRVRTLADYFGKVVVVFFGYTQCPDVCPTTLLRFKKVMKILGSDADRLQVIFITVDPERDTSEVLKAYLPLFDSRFLGLRGNAEETAAAAKSFRVFYERLPGPTPTSYVMNHSAFGYAIDKGGHTRLLIAPDLEAEQVAQDLRYLIET